MAINFPNNPTVDDIHDDGTYKWICKTSIAVGGYISWGRQNATIGGIFVGPVPPDDPNATPTWFNTTTGLTSTYYNDGDSAQWVQDSVGDSGQDGAQGIQGIQGVTGATGPEGPTAISDDANNVLEISVNDNLLYYAGSGISELKNLSDVNQYLSGDPYHTLSYDPVLNKWDAIEQHGALGIVDFIYRINADNDPFVFNNGRISRNIPQAATILYVVGKDNYGIDKKLFFDDMKKGDTFEYEYYIDDTRYEKYIIDGDITVSGSTYTIPVVSTGYGGAALSDSDTVVLRWKKATPASIEGTVAKTGDVMSGTLELPDAIISAVSKQITATTVDVFVYDTSKDDDGGAWREQTEGTSWHQEALNTATRGATRKFPAIAVIVAEADKVTIYDATDVNLPMWMVFNAIGTVNSAITMIGPSNDNRSVAIMHNAFLYTGIDTAVAFNGMTLIDFKTDWATYKTTVDGFIGNIVERNVQKDMIAQQTGTNGIVNGSVNDVAVTSNGNMENTVAVATDGGVSVIHPDGSVADITGTVSTNNISEYVGFLESRLYFGSRGSSSLNVYHVMYGEIPAVDDSATLQGKQIPNYNTYTAGANKPPVLEKPGFFTVANNVHVLPSINGLTLAIEGEGIGNLNSYLTSEYSTGFALGDIKGMFLANSATINRFPPTSSVDLTQTGTITEAPVATGAELMGYSGWSATDYLSQAYNADLDFGTGDFYVMGWIDSDNFLATFQNIFYRGDADTLPRFHLEIISSQLRLTTRNNAGTNLNLDSTSFGLGLKFFVALRDSAGLKIYLNGSLDAEKAGTALDITSATGAAILTVGTSNAHESPFLSSLSLLRIGAGAPTAEQIKEIYEAELPMFQENAKCLLQGSSSDIKALSYNEDKDLLTVCSLDHVTRFNGLTVASDEVRIATSVSSNGKLEVFGD